MVNEFAICSKSAAGFPLSVVGPGRGGAPRLGGIVPLQLLFEFLQAPVEIARVDRPDEGVNHCRDPACLARRDHTSGERRGHRLHRRGDIRRALDRRQLELDRPFAADRQKAFDAEPQRHRVAGERRLDGLARQSFSLAREQLCGGEGRLVARAGPAAGGITRPAFLDRIPRTGTGEFAKTSSFIFAPRVQSASVNERSYNLEYGGFMVVISQHEKPQANPAQFSKGANSIAEIASRSLSSGRAERGPGGSYRHRKRPSSQPFGPPDISRASTHRPLNKSSHCKLNSLG